MDLNDYKNKIDYIILKKILKFKKILKDKILNLKIKNIYIGDILYDDYLRKFYKGTINIKKFFF